MEPGHQCYAMLVWGKIGTINLERHLNQAFKMFMSFIPMLRIYLKKIILSVGKYGNIMKSKDIGNRLHL